MYNIIFVNYNVRTFHLVRNATIVVSVFQGIKTIQPALNLPCSLTLVNISHVQDHELLLFCEDAKLQSLRK